MNSLSVNVCQFVLVHEIMHIIFKHNLRIGNRKPIRWNKACDYAINQELQDAGIEVWEHCLIDAKYKGMTAEQIYDVLTMEKEKEKGKKRGGGTDMRLPLKYAEKYEPCCVILVTDCETPWPSEPTPFPLIVCSTTKAKCPDWALRIDMR